MKPVNLPLAIALLTSLSFTGNTAHAADGGTGVTVGGFVDAYYGYELNNPGSFDRAFTTQPARHNEFNINLAYVELKLERERVRGRFALQAGTSVQNNYSAEPGRGEISGPSLAQHIQEGYAGYRLAEHT